MKKVLYLAMVVAACMLMANGCRKNGSETMPNEPKVELTALESSFTSFSFKATFTNADEAAYICLEADEVAPTSEEILSDGTRMDLSGDAASVTEELTGLVSATSYKLYVAASNAEAVMSEPAVLDFSTESDLYADVKSTTTLAWYYGLYDYLDSDLVFLSLCNAELDPYSAMPSGEGELIRLYMYTEKTSMENVALAAGTYTIKENPEGAFDIRGGDYGSSFCMSTDQGWMQIGYESGTVTVERDGNMYKIVANLVLADGEGTKVRGTFEGELKFDDLTDGYFHFDSDMNEVLTGHSGGIYEGDENYSEYMMTFYNCELDEDGFIIGAGYIFNATLFFDVAGGDYSGVYTPDHDWDNGFKRYTYVPGAMMDYSGFHIPYGTYLAEYDEYGTMVRIGLVVDGDIDVSIADGVLKMSGVLTTDKGHEITVSYEGPENLTDMRGTYSSTSASVKVRTAGKPADNASVSDWRAL